MDKIQNTSSSLVQGDGNLTPGSNQTAEAFEELERRVHSALETYSNIHRGSGYNSIVSTHLFEQARNIVLEYLGLKKSKYVVIFCTPGRAVALREQLPPQSYQIMSSEDIGLSIGVRALAVERKALPKGTPFQTGGGTARLVSPGWVIWAGAPARFEAGTPAIINIIAFVAALKLISYFENDAFKNVLVEKLTAAQILYHDEMEEYSGREMLDVLRKTRAGNSATVPTGQGVRSYINLDNAASTPAFTPVWSSVCQTWRQHGKVQQEIVQEVRSICAGALSAPLSDYDLIFTSNTTEAINLTAESLNNESEPETEYVVLNTCLEHNSNDLPWRNLPQLSLIRMTVDTEGFVDLNELDTIMNEYNLKCQHGKKRIRLVAMNGASNVLGVFNDLEEISRIVHRYGARFLVDAAQLVAHRKVSMEKSGIDYLAFSAHKMYAPFGTGVLMAKKGLLHFSQTRLEVIKSSGEENVTGIAALGKAFVLLQRIGLDLICSEEQALTRHALSGMAQIEGLTVYGIKDPESPRFAQKGGVIAFSLKNMMPDRVARELAERAGIGVRYGCHCAHILIKHLLGVGPALARFQGILVNLFPRLNLPGVVRVSFGIETSEEEVDVLIHELNLIAGKAHGLGDSRSDSEFKKITRLPGARVQQQINDLVKAATLRVYSQFKHTII